MDQIASVRPRREHRDSAALAVGLVAPITWGMTGVFVRLLHGVPILQIVATRLLVAVVLLSPWALRRRHLFQDVFRSPLAAAMGAYYIFATEAFARAPVVEVTLLVGSAPVIAVGLEFLRGLRPTREQILGALVAISGLVIFLRPGGNITNARGLGYVFALGAAAVSAIYAVGLRARVQSQRPLDPLALTIWACMLGVLASFLLSVRTLGHGGLPAPSAHESMLLVLLGGLSTAVPTLAFGIASARLPSVLTTSLSLTTPLFAALFAGLFLAEWPALVAAPGALITVAGVVMVLRSPARRTQRSA